MGITANDVTSSGAGLTAVGAGGLVLAGGLWMQGQHYNTDGLWRVVTDKWISRVGSYTTAAKVVGIGAAVAGAIGVGALVAGRIASSDGDGGSAGSSKLLGMDKDTLWWLGLGLLAGGTAISVASLGVGSKHLKAFDQSMNMTGFNHLLTTGELLDRNFVEIARAGARSERVTDIGYRALAGIGTLGVAAGAAAVTANLTMPQQDA